VAIIHFLKSAAQKIGGGGLSERDGAGPPASGDDRRDLALNSLSREDMICACERMAAKELAMAQTASGRQERTDHVYNAASWSDRADLLSRISASLGRREAMDKATQEARAERANSSGAP
jgi:hypothetical protein